MSLYIMHHGVGHDKGGHSGRYPWGSGKNPYGGQGTRRLDRRATKLLYKDVTDYKQSDINLDNSKNRIYKKWARDISGLIGRNYTDMRFNPKTIVERGDDISAARVMSDPESENILRERIKSDPNYKKDLDEMRRGYIQVVNDTEETIKKWANHYDLTSLKKGKVSAQRELDALISLTEKGKYYTGLNPKTATDEEFGDYIIKQFRRNGESYKNSYNRQREQEIQEMAYDSINEVNKVLRTYL